MSKFEDGSYGSLAGVALIGKILAGRCEMTYTRASVGKGTIPEGESPKTMSEPAEYVMDAKISAVTNPVDGECQVTVQINSSDVEKGFYATNIVLYAEDPDEGEVPYTYLSLENEPEWIRPANSIVGKLATFDIIAAVGGVDAVTAIIDPEAIATVSRVEEMLSKHNTDPNAHGGIGSTKILEIVIPKGAWIQTAEKAGYMADVSVSDANAEAFPSIALHDDALSTAFSAGMQPTVQALDGVLRFWANLKPSADMKATLALLFHSNTIAGASGTEGSNLPAATQTRLGGVKIGEGLSVSPDGTLSVDGNALAEDISASDDAVKEALNAIYGEGSV